METSTVNSSSSTNKTPLPPPASTRTPQKTLGQQDFLKLITVQLAKQDPMKPMEDTAFIAQMAQFTSLEQSKALVGEFSLMRASSDFTAASALLGRQVSISKKDGTEVTGQVTSVEAGKDEPLLKINGQSYGLSTVFRVAPYVTQPAA